MKKTTICGLAGLAGLFLIGSLMRSPESQVKGATYSSPVTVVNTTANPASVLDADEATRVPYVSVSNTSTCGTFICTFSFSIVPIGTRLVVESISGSLSLGYTPSALPMVGTFGTFNSTRADFLESITNPGPFFAGAIGFNQQVKAYFDPFEIPQAFVTTYGQTISGSGQVILTGYLVNCSVAGCPAVHN